MRLLTLVFIILGMAGAAVPASAHHSFAAEFDANKPMTLQGHVTRIAWTNPHVWIYMNVADEAGKMVNWGFEMGAPHQVRRRGWDRTTLKAGDEIIVQGYLARDGSPRMNARTITWAEDGRELGAASSIEDSPQ